ncbi:saccharopine dehydrogenase NADP-binding domain-containing protein [Gammaproteobacteria bacterium]|nr:saccharopine dehydrogenase NADP-binding domain-containing protein [Gammaproteobacteria bacterium]
MKILAIGGCGSMGRYAMRTAQNFSSVEKIVIADIDKKSAETFAGNLNQKVSAMQLDVNDGDALKKAMKDINIVVNTCGPYFKFAAPILKAAISSGCNYIDICDDWEPTIDMMQLDAAAKLAGISATIGLGASPGLTNLMALIAIRELDEVTTVYTGWDIDGISLDENAMQQSENAAMMHGVEQMTGQVKVFKDGIFKMVKPLQKINVDYPGLAMFHGNIFGHPEAVTFPNYFPTLKDSINLAHGGHANFFILKSIMSLVNLRLLSKEKAANLFSLLESKQSSQNRPKGGDYPPVMYGFAYGTKNGIPASAGVCIPSNSENSDLNQQIKNIGMGEITGIPLACGIKMLVEGRINQTGVLAPEAGHIEPHGFITNVFEEISIVLGLPKNSLNDSIQITRSW